MSETVAWALVTVVSIFAFGVAGTLDHDEAERQQAEYCYNVEAKIWPDYERSYDKNCRNLKQIVKN